MLNDTHVEANDTRIERWLVSKTFQVSCKWKAHPRIASPRLDAVSVSVSGHLSSRSEASKDESFLPVAKPSPQWSHECSRSSSAYPPNHKSKPPSNSQHGYSTCNSSPHPPFLFSFVLIQRICELDLSHPEHKPRTPHRDKNNPGFFGVPIHCKSRIEPTADTTIKRHPSHCFFSFSPCSRHIQLDKVFQFHKGDTTRLLPLSPTTSNPVALPRLISLHRIHWARVPAFHACPPGLTQSLFRGGALSTLTEHPRRSCNAPPPPVGAVAAPSGPPTLSFVDCSSTTLQIPLRRISPRITISINDDKDHDVTTGALSNMPTGSASAQYRASSSNCQFQLDDSHSMTPPPLGTDQHSRTAPGPLQIVTDINLASPPRSDSLGRSLSSAFHPVSRTPSFKRAIAAALGTGSAINSRVPSPVISAMGDVTPLPSPLLSGDSPGPWKRFANRSSSRDPMPNAASDAAIVSTSSESSGAALLNAPKRKTYASLEGAEGSAKTPEGLEGSGSVERHGRNRSVSEYVPDPMSIPRRQSTVSGPRVKPEESTGLREPHLRREANLAESRGLTPTVAPPPTPPPSESSKDATDPSATESKPKVQAEYFEACHRDGGKRRRWRAIKLLGQGTFSRVMLATSQANGEEDDDQPIAGQPGIVTPTSDKPSPRRKCLVAIKVCEHGPKGGASEERIEMSLKRELEIMQSIHHPSLVHLKAWNIEPSRAILVLSHCAGGDLFDVATAHRDVLQPALLRRMFSELVGAVRYLHDRKICHRDIKLETPELADPTVDWTTYPYSVVTLTDLGLSRRIADDEKLETRCGSEDYAAPEVIMGLPYDGRATDAWSLGVLLYALLESRLPFDPYPGTGNDGHRMRSRTSHRIARAEWRWIQYAGDDGNHEGSIAKFKEKDMLGAMEITEGLLMRARTRWTLDKVAANEWVAGAIQVEGGIQFREEDEGRSKLDRGKKRQEFQIPAPRLLTRSSRRTQQKEESKGHATRIGMSHVPWRIF
ncbi:kinase-like protein [Sodiomyces alkalinus F11]|uniref:Kinase-like protein n=1 Tax=Sodiomyces alkalinus (strain CBS 110278 / VKM F-3762 / F11) TaxID=1314773 RepID=A0A3N2PZH9_SODAK|nr:kinase-like protein [Sodiomyces alkalinus F11]ROT39903.1 kinase-like protein [Sodiomyces alkalinus F11]